MPRGLIVSSYGNSYYQVEVENDNALRVDPMIEQINQRLELLEREVDYLKDEMDVADLNIRIAAHNLSLIPLPIKQSDMAAATAQLASAKQYKKKLEIRLQRIDALQRGFLARRTELAGFGATVLTILAYTVMPTTGETYCFPVLPIGTQVDVAVWDDDVSVESIGYSILTVEAGKQGYSTGVYTPSPLLGTYSLHYNHTIQDGHRRWAPQYPIGVVMGIDIKLQTFDIAISRLEYRKTLPALTFCMALAAQVGDRMVVDVRNNAVIGFAENPRVCTPSYITTQNESKTVTPGVSYLATGAPKDDPKYRYEYRVVYSTGSSSFVLGQIFTNDLGDDCEARPDGKGECTWGVVTSSQGSYLIVAELNLAGTVISEASTVVAEDWTYCPQSGSGSRTVKTDKYNFYICKRTGAMSYTKREVLTEVLYDATGRTTTTTTKLWSVGSTGSETLNSTTVSTGYMTATTGCSSGNIYQPTSTSGETTVTVLGVYAPKSITYSLC